MFESSILVIVGVVVGVVVALLVALMLLSKNYIKVSPNQAAVISGRTRRLGDGTTVGYRQVRGGATLVVPFLEKVEYLDLNVITVPLATSRAYTSQGVPVSVKAVANVKIKGDDESLRAAAERFLGMPQDQFHGLIFQTLEGHLRAILGTLTVEEINNDRQSFAQKLTSEAAGDLEKMGIGLDALTIQEISDEEGYLDALGKRRTAEVKRDAEIGQAEANRDSKIKASLALQEGEKVRLETEALIAQSNRQNGNSKSAGRRGNSKGTRDRQSSRTARRSQSAAGSRRRRSPHRTHPHAGTNRRAGTGSSAQEKELEATVVKQAEADRRASVLAAQGAQEAAILEAEGRKQAQIAQAEAEAAKLQREGEGRAFAVTAEGRAEAERIRALGLAEAESNKAQGLAEAEKLQATGLAQAKAIEAQGLAEAAAIKEKAAAWREFNDAARLQTILEKLPSIIEASAPVFQAVAEPLGKIDKVVMIDNGGNGNGNGNGSSGINRFAQTAPTMIFTLLQQLQAMGLTMPEVMAQLGINQDEKLIETKEIANQNGSAEKESAPKISE
jgi:flotillin